MAKGAFGLTYNEMREDKESTKNKTLSSKKKKKILIGREVKKSVK